MAPSPNFAREGPSPPQIIWGLFTPVILCQLRRPQLWTARRIGPMGASTKNRPGPTGINKSQTPYGLCLELSTVSSRRVEQP